MEINTNETGELEFSKVYTPIRIVANPKEPHLTIVVRDNGFKIAYGDHVLHFRKGDYQIIISDD